MCIRDSLSKTSVSKSGYVQKEIRFVLDVAAEQPEGSIFLVPARIEEGVQISDVAEELGRRHWVDLFSEAGYRRLHKALQARASECGASVAHRRPDLQDQAAPFGTAGPVQAAGGRPGVGRSRSASR